MSSSTTEKSIAYNTPITHSTAPSLTPDGVLCRGFDPFGDLMRLVATNSEGRNKITFEGLKQYRDFMHQLAEHCSQAGPACGQYVAVTNIDQNTFNRISGFSGPITRTCRFSYDNTKKQVIIKYMPGAVHQPVGQEFFLAIREVIIHLPGHNQRSVMALGKSTFGVPGIRSKQGDQALKPATRAQAGAWPSLVIEVGYSESLQELRCDARWWLINSNGQTRIVIIIHITYKPGQKSLLIETWRMVDNLGRVTRSTPSKIPAQTSSLTVNDQGVLNPQNGNIRIAYEDVFDASPPVGVGDIVLPTAEIQRLGRFIFQNLQ